MQFDDTKEVKAKDKTKRPGLTQARTGHLVHVCSFKPWEHNPIGTGPQFWGKPPFPMSEGDLQESCCCYYQTGGGGYQR